MNENSNAPSADQPPPSIALEKLNIPHQVFRHKNSINSLEQAASERNQRPEQVVRSILFQIRSEEFLMVLVAGPDQVDWRRPAVGQDELSAKLQNTDCPHLMEQMGRRKRDGIYSAPTNTTHVKGGNHDGR